MNDVTEFDPQYAVDSYRSIIARRDRATTANIPRSPTMHRSLAAVTILLVLASQALAWSDAGHKIVASIALSGLTPAEREKVVTILSKHPRFQVDFVDARPENADPAEWCFQQASVWPDIARGFKGEDAKFNHGTWHYVNVPHFLSPGDEQALTGKLKVNQSLDAPAAAEEKMNVIQTLRVARAMLVDPNVSDPDKAVMMTWLFHLVGDIHQPLHSSALFSQKLFPEGDRGGNDIKTTQRGNLHSLWDGFLGGKASVGEARQDALKLISDPEMAALGEKAALKLDEKDWLDESRELAVNVAYGPEVVSFLRNLEDEGKAIQPLTLDESYLKAGGVVSKKRVVEAAYRLAAVLKQIVD
jgi:hypothetical protein